MVQRITEAVGGVAVGAFVFVQTQSPPDYFKEYGVPLAYLLLTISLASIIVRVLWTSNQKKDEKIDAMTKEFTATIKTMSEQQTQAFNGLASELRQGRVKR